MRVDALLDTNVLIYAAAGHRDAPAKNEAALRLIEAGNFGLSGQILAEFYSVATRKLKVPLTEDEACAWIERLVKVPVVPVDAELVQEGILFSRKHTISYWDGAMLAAARRLKSPLVYSEDLSHDHIYGPVKVINPFRPN
jgi:predicted nucleic acid-binding protein